MGPLSRFMLLCTVFVLLNIVKYQKKIVDDESVTAIKIEQYNTHESVSKSKRLHVTEDTRTPTHSSDVMPDQPETAMNSLAKDKFSVWNNLQSRSWQPCGNGSDVFVYSAYYRPEEHDVRVVGIALRKVNRTVICTFPRESELQEVTATVKVLPDHHNRVSCPVYITCTLDKENSVIIDAVGIKVDGILTLLKVIHPKPRQFNFTVCVACLFGPYTEYWRLIEMVEADRMFGADRFVMYKHSVSQQVDKVLKYYVRIGILEVLPWKHPGVSIHYHGQMAQIQDCILSSRGISKYVVIKDIDELIVPHSHSNWNDLMAFLDTDNRKQASFVFRNSFFDLNISVDHPRKPELPFINSLTFFWRNKRFGGPWDRSKSIHRPELVQVGGIHYCWLMQKGFDYHWVNVNVAYLHHYRVPPARKKKIVKNTVMDTRMLTFKDTLIANINQTHSRLKLNFLQ